MRPQDAQSRVPADADRPEVGRLQFIAAMVRFCESLCRIDDQLSDDTPGWRDDMDEVSAMVEVMLKKHSEVIK